MFNDTEFIISSYMNNGITLPDTTDPDQAAIEWSEKEMVPMIHKVSSLEELEQLWVDFMSNIKHHRRESDWKSIELFGMNNQDHYEKLKSEFIRRDIDNEIDSINNDHGTIVSEASYFDDDDIQYQDSLTYTGIEVEEAIKWAEDSNRTIIVPTRTLAELEALWDGYNAMIKKHKRESDWKSLELFSVNNQKHYEYLKSQFLRNDIRGPYDVSYIESSGPSFLKKYYTGVCKNGETIQEGVASLLRLPHPPRQINENLITNDVISDVLDNIGLSDTVPSMDFSSEYVPYYTPDEMIDMGVFSPIDADNYFGHVSSSDYFNEDITTKDWFDSYVAAADGFYTEFYQWNSDRMDNLRLDMVRLKRLKESNADESKINALKQRILELGWNPDVELNNKSMRFARRMMNEHVSKLSYPIKVVDLRGFRVGDIKKNVLNENSNTSNLKPIYIVLIQGKAPISTVIRKVTKSEFSHVGISLDASLTEIHSYGMDAKDESKSRFVGGYRSEDITKYVPGVRISLYCIFVTKETYKKVEDVINSFKENKAKTKYSYINLLTYLFNIPLNKDWSMVCSQFTDKVLKLAGINITNRDSSLVAPEDFHKILADKQKIYNLYQGLAVKYKEKDTEKLINALLRTAVPYTEQNKLYYTNEAMYISGIVDNIHNLPVLIEMMEHREVVKNPVIKRLLDETVFDMISVEPFDSCEVNESFNSTSMSYINSMIDEFVSPIA